MSSARNNWSYLLVLSLLLGYLFLGYYLNSTFEDSNKAEQKKTTLILAIPSDKRFSPILKKLVSKFEKENTDIKVKLLNIGGNYYQKVLVMIAGGVSPDLMWMGRSFSEFATRDVFMDLTERIKTSKKITLSNYKRSILDLYKIKGRYYSIPYALDATFLIYNRKMFREAGLPDPEDDWDFNAFIKIAQKLTIRDSDGKIIRAGFYGIIPRWAFGAWLFNPLTKEASFNTPEMVNYIQTNLDLMNKYKVCKTLNDQKQQISDYLSNFKQGRVAISTAHTSWARAFELLKDMDWGMTLSPKIVRQGEWASSRSICIYKNTKYPDAAWKLFEYFQDNDFQLALSNCTLPAKTKLVNIVATQTENRPYNFKVVKKLFNILCPTPRVPHLQELLAVYGRFMDKIRAGQLTPAAGMKKCSEEIKRKIERFKINEQKTKN